MTTRPRADRFLALLEEHRKILFKVSGLYAREPADRQDLAQEIAAQLWRSFSRYDERLRFSTWMYRVALNVAISFVRTESRRRRHFVPADDVLFELPVAVSDAAEIEEGLAELRRLVDGLDPFDRALVLLHLDGNRHDAIAEVLGISETNVGTKLHRIKERLRRDAARGR